MQASSLTWRFGAIYFLLLLFSLPLAAQEGGLPAKEKFRFLAGFDSRTTIINRETIGITGLRVGLKKNKYAFGIGGYDSRFLGILGRTLSKPFTLDEFSPERTVDADVDFRYLSVFGEYYLVRQKKVILALNTQLGAGNIRVAYDLDGEPVVRKLRKGLVEHYAKLRVLPLPWLELSGGVGYRYLIDGEPQIKQSFSGPVYTIGGWIYFGKLFGKKKKVSQ
jgi:hypothetical protein